MSASYLPKAMILSSAKGRGPSHSLKGLLLSLEALTVSYLVSSLLVLNLDSRWINGQKVEQGEKEKNLFPQSLDTQMCPGASAVTLPGSKLEAQNPTAIATNHSHYPYHHRQQYFRICKIPRRFQGTLKSGQPCIHLSPTPG